MRIRQVTMTARQPERAARFYADVLGLRTEKGPGVEVVAIGRSRLTMEQGEAFAGVHHLAFGIAPADFERAHGWLDERVELLTASGSQVIIGPEGWDSRSLYFLGPEDIVLELIARDADAGTPASDGPTPTLHAISEVGIAVPDVPAAVHRLGADMGLPPFPPQGPTFAPVGGHDGLLIVVQEDRVWFPTEGLTAAGGPVHVQVEGSRQTGCDLTPTAAIRMSQRAVT